MSWVKRNLYFLIGSVVAVGLLAFASFYMLGTSASYTEVKTKLAESYEKLKTLKNKEPSAGSGKVDNITNAQAQVEVLKAYMKDARTVFEPIAPIPNIPKIDRGAFSSELLHTLDSLRRQATEAGVVLPSTNPPYNFTFDSIVRKVDPKPTSLPVLARQLGDIRAIADVLIKAKVSTIASMKRWRAVPEDEPSANPADYHAENPTTNDWAILSPYEVTFHGLSGELAGVLNGFANSKHCLIVQAINLEPAPQSEASPFAVGMPDPVPGPMYAPPVMMGGGKIGGGIPGGMDPTMAARMRSRYGMGAGAGGGAMRGEGRFGPPQRPQPIAPPPPMYQPPPGAPTASVPNRPVLSERQVRVTLKILTVQLLPTDGEAKRRSKPAAN